MCVDEGTVAVEFVQRGTLVVRAAPAGVQQVRIRRCRLEDLAESELRSSMQLCASDDCLFHECDSVRSKDNFV